MSDLLQAGMRVALELECLLMDTRDTAIRSKWWDSAHEALAQWREIASAPPENPLVHIDWRAPDADWPWFRLLDVRKEWVLLQGVDYPDGSATHNGDRFWTHRGDIKLMRSPTMEEIPC